MADSAAAVEAALGRAREMGFLGPGPLGPQIRHAHGFADAYRARRPVGLGLSPDRIVDLGSGGGLPGLVLALDWPDASMALLEAGERRARFLRGAVEACDLEGRLSVLEQRAEHAGRVSGLRATFDVAVARSFGSPAVTAECAAPLLRVGGCLVVSEPPDAERSDRWSAEGLARVGLRDHGGFRAEFGYRVLVLVETPDERFPRRAGVPAKRPLF